MQHELSVSNNCIEIDLNVELHRWMYTAFTRARERLYLLNFVDAFFPDGGAGSSD